MKKPVLLATDENIIYAITHSPKKSLGHIVKFLQVDMHLRTDADTSRRIKDLLGLRCYSMERKETYPVEEVMRHVGVAEVMFDGDIMKMRSARYEVFKQCGIKCVSCGIVGTHFVKERSHNSGPYHFNLYATNANGYEVLMTKDHIIPKSKGGKDSMDNYQTMCVVCNVRKSDTHEPEAQKILTNFGGGLHEQPAMAAV
jgi:5-methylcytosine-specific restriction endonuclease McrA